MLEVQSHTQINPLATGPGHVTLTKDSDAVRAELMALKSSPPAPMHFSVKNDIDINCVDQYAGKSSSQSPVINRVGVKEESDGSPLGPNDHQKADDKMAVLGPSSPEQTVKSVPIHCVVENITAPGREAVVDIDTYAILPGSTLFCEVIRSTLVKIGYSATEAIGAKGAVQIRNWKPLCFHAITDNRLATVQEILGDLSSIATLRIKLGRKPRPSDDGDANQVAATSPEVWRFERVRTAVNELLLEISQSKLSTLCPLSQTLISNILNSKYDCNMSEETCNKFRDWYKQHRSKNPVKDNFDGTTVESRMTFHPLYELPKLRHWFEKCDHPSNTALAQYTDELNNSPVRKERKALTTSQLKIWWKNEKQKRKRIQDFETTPLREKSKRQKTTPNIRDDVFTDMSRTTQNTEKNTGVTFGTNWSVLCEDPMMSSVCLKSPEVTRISPDKTTTPQATTKRDRKSSARAATSGKIATGSNLIPSPVEKMADKISVGDEQSSPNINSVTSYLSSAPEALAVTSPPLRHMTSQAVYVTPLLRQVTPAILVAVNLAPNVNTVNITPTESDRSLNTQDQTNLLHSDG